MNEFKQNNVDKQAEGRVIAAPDVTQEQFDQLKKAAQKLHEDRDAEVEVK